MRTKPRRPGGRATVRSYSAQLRQLSEEFSRFRQTGRKNRRIPQTLRAAALNLIDRGIPITAVKNACGVSSKQLGHWKKAGENAGSAAEAEIPPRVFTVRDRPRPTLGRAEDLADAAPPLELQFGPWKLRLSYEAATPAHEDGERPCFP
jgi:transposase-like protein